MMNKEQKKNYIEEMTSKFESSKAVMVTHYQGLTMTQLDDLRAKMREHGIVFKITKNRITKLALEKTKCKDLSNLFTGPTAVAFGEDAIMSARILSKFAKDNENLKLIGGIMDDKVRTLSSIIPPINLRFSLSLANLDKILADIIASSPNATAVGPVKRLDKSLHLVFSNANFVILFLVILKTIPCSLIFALKSSN